MTRRMGDATHANVPALAAAGPWDLVAGYVTGTPDIQWTATDMATFAGIPVVTIDQGANGSPVASADVRDVQTGAWTPPAAVNLTGWTAARPTIYCNQSTLPAVLAAGWQGDLWLAIPGWQPGQALPAAPGCTIVAVQNELDVNGTYDVSAVTDPYWPSEVPVAVSVTQSAWAFCVKCRGLWWANGQAAGGVCPAGGQHDNAPGNSFDYSVLYAQ